MSTAGILSTFTLFFLGAVFFLGFQQRLHFKRMTKTKMSQSGIHHSDMSMMNFHQILLEYTNKEVELKEKIKAEKNEAILKLLMLSLQNVQQQHKRFLRRLRPF